jgi:hypothetical protein
MSPLPDDFGLDQLQWFDLHIDLRCLEEAFAGKAGPYGFERIITEICSERPDLLDDLIGLVQSELGGLPAGANRRKALEHILQELRVQRPLSLEESDSWQPA